MTLAYKEAAALAALRHIPHDCRLGVGTGSTVNFLIDALPQVRGRIAVAVASSEETARRLEIAGFRCADPNAAGELHLYLDGADEVDGNRQMLKGGGGAHTREKILAVAARRFIALVDESKTVNRLGKFPLAVEVVPLARALVARRIAAMGGKVAWREGVVTDNGNWILDATGLDLTAAVEIENRLNQIPGVVENGLFAVRRADLVIIAGADGVREQTPADDGK